MAPKKLPELIDSRIITSTNKPALSDLRKGALILVNKPLEWTSFDVVNKIRSSIKYGLGIKKMKVGHAGTLDPLATLAIQSPSFTGSIFGSSRYQAFTLFFDAFNGIDMSKGCDKSIVSFFELYCIVVIKIN